MATSKPWNKDNGVKTIFSLLPGKKQWLNKQVPMLKDLVQMRSLWDQLTALDVLDKGKAGRIQLNATNEEQVAGLCEHLQVSAIWKWHAFLRCLVLTDQESVLDALKIDDPNVYKDEPPVESPPSATGCLQERDHGNSTNQSGRLYSELTHEEVKALLTEHKIKFYDRFEINNRVLAELKRVNVVTADVENKYKAAGITPEGVIDAILERVEKRGVKVFQDFCRVLYDRGQGDLVTEVLGLKIIST